MPTDAYRRFRSITMYGGTGHRLDSADIVQFLQWVRKFPPVAGGAR